MNATINDVRQEAVRAALHAITESNGGVLEPRRVVDAARDSQSILHAYFEWDDARAGDAYRIAQVGALVRRVRYTVVRMEPESRQITIGTTRGFQSRPSMRHAAGGYEDIGTILTDQAKRAELLAMVVGELAAYRRRYAELAELNPVWLAVDEAQEDLVPSQVSSPSPVGEASRPGSAG